VDKIQITTAIYRMRSFDRGRRQEVPEQGESPMPVKLMRDLASSKIQRPKMEGFHERRKIRSTGVATQTYIPSYCVNM